MTTRCCLVTVICFFGLPFRPVSEIVRIMRRNSINKWVSLVLSVLMLISPLSSLAITDSSDTSGVNQSFNSGTVAAKPRCHNQNSESKSNRKLAFSADKNLSIQHHDKHHGECSGLCLCSIGGCSATAVPSFEYSFSFNVLFVRHFSMSASYSSPYLDLSNPPPIS